MTAAHDIRSLLPVTAIDSLATTIPHRTGTDSTGHAGRHARV
jgi:hypothetical protein